MSEVGRWGCCLTHCWAEPDSSQTERPLLDLSLQTSHDLDETLRHICTHTHTHCETKADESSKLLCTNCLSTEPKSHAHCSHLSAS